MMGEEKFASLSSGLLARKGGAKPAMRRQNFINPQGDVSEDLGWNDMGDEPNPPQHLTSVTGEEQFDAPVPAVRKQIDDLADSVGHNSNTHDASTVIKAELPEAPIEHHYAGLTPLGVENDLTDVEDEDVEDTEIMGEDVSTPDVETAEPIVSLDQTEDRPETPEVKVEVRQPEPVIEAPKPLVEAKAVVPAPQPTTPKRKKVLARHKKAFTLRLDKDRHLKLRLASAVSNRSAQQIVTEALDRYLETIPNIANFADAAPRDEDI